MRILVVEDDILIATHIKEIIEEYDSTYTVTCAHSEEDCLKYLASLQPDLVLLDIRMEDNGSGITLAAYIHSQHKIPHAFITAQSDRQNMDNAFESAPLGYIVKPFRPTDIYSLLKLAQQNGKISFFTAKTANSITRIPVKDILFLKAENNYIDVFTNERKFTVRLTLGAAQRKLLGHNNFIQTHRSYIVNKDYINVVSKGHVIVQKHEIPVSKPYAHLLDV